MASGTLIIGASKARHAVIEPEVIEQLRVWVVELAEEADEMERRTARLANVRCKERWMGVEKRELYSSSNSDRWFLCRDPAINLRSFDQVSGTGHVAADHPSSSSSAFASFRSGVPKPSVNQP